MPLRDEHDPSSLNPDAARCRAKSKRTGKRCKNVAIRGKRVCRLHGGLSLSGENRTEKQKTNRPPAAGKVNRGSFQKGNQAARKHGAYTSRLTPEEREEIERLRAAFTEDAGKRGPVTAFDSQIIEMAAMASVKTHAAIIQDAPVRIGVFWSRLFLKCLRELRATRASRKTDTAIGNTYEEVMAAMLEQIKRRTSTQIRTSDGDSEPE